MTEHLDMTNCVEAYANIYSEAERKIYPDSEDDCTVAITLPSNVWVSPQGARKIAADLIKAAEEVEAELQRRQEI